VSELLVREQLVPHPRSEVFAFFGDAANLQRLTPDFLDFRILTPLPIAMGAGTRIDYRIRLFGVGLRWQTLIERFDPDECFVDTQLKGPYRRWHHTHEFVEVPGGTLMRDRVEYDLPLGPLGTLAHALFVKRTLARIFDYRRDTVARLFPGGAP
jgi:hypothetical protein